MNKQELANQIAEDVKNFQRKGGLIDFKPARKIKVKKTVYTGSNKRGGRQQDSRGWMFAPQGYGYSGHYAEWKGEE